MKKSYNSKFKSHVAQEALRGELTEAEITGENGNGHRPIFRDNGMMRR